MTHITKLALTCVAVVFIASCGGGGSSTPTTPPHPPADTSPSFGSETIAD